MSDTKAQLRVPTTSFSRPSTPRSTSASSIKSTRERSADFASTHEKRERAAASQDVAVPPPSPGRSGINTPVSGTVSANMITLLAGQTGKPFIVHTDLLTGRSTYFREILVQSDETGRYQDTRSYPDLDEFAFALFVRWLYGATLTGPTDFHSMHHYVGLYILALRFRIERLQNNVMDLVRFYYRTTSMTSPPYRIDYIYDNTTGPNLMRTFLVQTAAYRLLCEGAVSDAMKCIIRKGGDRAVDLTEQVVKLHVDGLTDARRGSDCAWHEHKDTPVCKKQLAEAYEAD